MPSFLFHRFVEVDDLAAELCEFHAAGRQAVLQLARLHALAHPGKVLIAGRWPLTGRDHGKGLAGVDRRATELSEFGAVLFYTWRSVPVGTLLHSRLISDLQSVSARTGSTVGAAWVERTANDASNKTNMQAVCFRVEVVFITSSYDSHCADVLGPHSVGSPASAGGAKARAATRTTKADIFRNRAT